MAKRQSTLLAWSKTTTKKAREASENEKENDDHESEVDFSDMSEADETP